MQSHGIWLPPEYQNLGTQSDGTGYDPVTGERYRTTKDKNEGPYWTKKHLLNDPELNGEGPGGSNSGQTGYGDDTFVVYADELRDA